MAQDFIIATASTSDLDRSYLDEHNIPFISYTFVIDGHVVIDDCREQTKKELFMKMRQGSLPSTAQIPEYNYYEFFKELAKQGKDVLFFDMTRAVSNSFNNCEAAVQAIRRDFPDRRFYSVDTRCISAGLAFLVYQTEKRKEAGASFDECIRFAEHYKLKVMHHFMVDDLQWLRRGGRLSNAAAIAGTLLNIKPILYVSDEGTLVSSAKARGKKQALLQMIKSIKKDIGDPKGKDFFVFHADCPQDAWFVSDMIRKYYPEAGEITIQTEGPTIGSHVGPGFVCIVYEGEGRFF